MNGTISLFNKEGVRIRLQRYSGARHRRRVLKAWKESLTKTEGAYFIIEPDYDPYEIIPNLTIRQLRILNQAS